MRLTIELKGMLLVSVPLVFELFFVGILSHLLQKEEAETQRQLRSKTIIARANIMMKRAASVTLSAGGYTFTRDPALAKEFEDLLSLIMVDIDDLETMVMDKPEQRKHLAKMRILMQRLDKRLQAYKNMIQESSAGDMFAIIHSTNGLQQSRELISRMGKELDEFLSAERNIERFSPEARQISQRNIHFALWGLVLVSILVAISLARFFSTSISDRIATLTDNTRRLSRGEPLNEPMKGQDELSHLDGVFHEVVDHLNELSRQKQELVAVVSHELKSPLTSVNGLMALLQAGAFGNLTDKGKHRVALAEVDLMRLIRLINDLLDIEKMEAGKLDMCLSSVNISRILERATASVETLAERHHIQILAPGTSLCVYGDEERLVQVTVNLLSNAIKYSPEGAQVEISVVERDDQLEVRVTDRGRGIPDEFKGKIFERYTQLVKEDSTEKGGTGLGLYICKRIIEQLGGSIGVESELNKGSTFWFRLPAAKEGAVVLK